MVDDIGVVAAAAAHLVRAGAAVENIRRAIAEFLPGARPFRAPGTLDRLRWHLRAAFTSRTYEDILRGTEGYRRVEVNATGDRVRELPDSVPTPAEAGRPARPSRIRNRLL